MWRGFLPGRHSVLWVSSAGEAGHKIGGVSKSHGFCGGDRSALWRAGRQHGDQVEFIKQQKEVEAGGWSEWLDRRMKQVPGLAAGAVAALRGCAQTG